MPTKVAVTLVPRAKTMSAVPGALAAGAMKVPGVQRAEAGAEAEAGAMAGAGSDACCGGEEGG